MPPYNAISSPDNSKLEMSEGRGDIWVNQPMNSLLPPLRSANTPCPSLQPCSPHTQDNTKHFISQHHISVVSPVLNQPLRLLLLVTGECTK